MPIDDPSNQDSSRLALLEAAGQVFAEHGYQQATVREIVKRAGASVGAVNYHFRDKAALYREVLACAHDRTFAEFEAALHEPDPAQQLLHYVRVGLAHSLLENPGQAWTGRVLASELLGMDEHNSRELFQHVIAPRQKILFSIIRTLAGPDVPEECIKRHELSIVGQCAMYYICRPAVEMTYGRELSQVDLDGLSRHITNVALAGIQAECSTPNESAETVHPREHKS